MGDNDGDDHGDVESHVKSDDRTALLRKRRRGSSGLGGVMSRNRHDENTKTISRNIFFGYTFGHVLNDMTASLWFTYILVFLQKHGDMSETHAGVVFLTGQIVDAVFNPISGIAIDNMSNGSSKIYYVLFGSIGVALSFSLLWFVPPFLDGATPWYRVLWFSGWAAVFNIFWSFVQVAHFSLVDELATTTSAKLSLNKAAQVGSAMSAMLTFAIARVAFHLNTDHNTQFLVLVFCVIGTGCLAVFIFVSVLLKFVCAPKSDKDETKTNLEGTRSSDRYGKRIPWYGYFCVRDFYKSIVLYTKSRMIMIIVMTFLAPYLVSCSSHDMGMRTSASAMILYHTFYCVTVMSEWICCPQFGISQEKFLLLTFIILCTASGLLTMTIYALDPMLHDGDGIHAIFLPITLCGVVVYYLVATSRTFVNEVSSRYGSSFVIGCAGFCEKAIIGSVVIAIQENERKSDDGYWWAISIVPSVTALAGVIVAALFMVDAHKPVVDTKRSQ